MDVRIWTPTNGIQLREVFTAKTRRGQIMPDIRANIEVNALLVRLKTGTDHVRHLKEAEVRLEGQ